jgi:hypothetical protein
MLSVHTDAAGHAIPVVVGAGEVILSLWWGYQQDADRLARLDHDVGAAIGKQALVAHCRGLQESRRGELVQILAMVFQTQFVGLARMKGQMVGLKSVVGQDHDHLLRRRPWVCRSGCGNQGYQQTSKQDAMNKGHHGC